VFPHHADIGGGHLPTIGHAHPGLHLQPDLARKIGALEERRGNRHISAVGGDDSARQALARRRIH
jgi:hypothetical protein